MGRLDREELGPLLSQTFGSLLLTLTFGGKRGKGRKEIRRSMHEGRNKKKQAGTIEGFHSKSCYMGAETRERD